MMPHGRGKEGRTVFGYIRVRESELRVRELSLYRAAYCGLCRSLGRECGQVSRIYLSYDLTFMALVRAALAGETFRVGEHRCPVHPARKRPMVEPCPSIRFCAAAHAVMTRGKALDDLRDEKGTKRFRARLIRFQTRRACRRVRKAYPGLENAVLSRLDELAALEREGTPSADIPAECFGNLLADILSYGLEGPERTLARDIGMHTGKWIYLVDALDDFEDDVRRGRFNPIRNLYGTDALTDGIREDARRALQGEIEAIRLGTDLLTVSDPDVRALLEHILCVGMPETAESVLHPEPGKKKKRNGRRLGL